MTSRRHALLIISLLVCALPACADPPRPDVASGGPGVAAEAPAAVPDDDLLDAGGPDRVIIEIGRQQYRADLSDHASICLTTGGGIAVLGSVDGFADGHITVELPPEDWETLDALWDPPHVWLTLGVDDDGMPIELHAGGDVVADQPGLSTISRVDEFRIEDDRAWGSATFVDLGDLDASGDVSAVRPLTGRFAVECA